MTEPLYIDLDDTSKPYSAFETAKRILNQFKDRADAGPTEEIILKSKSPARRGAILELLSITYLLSVSNGHVEEMMQQGMAVRRWETGGKAIIGGAIECDVAGDVATIKLKKDGDELPVYRMEKRLESIQKDIFPNRPLPSIQISDPSTNKPIPAPYSVLFFANRPIAELALHIISIVAQAHGVTDESQIFTMYEGIQTPQGKFPAVLVQSDTLKTLLTTEAAKEHGMPPRGGDRPFRPRPENN